MHFKIKIILDLVLPYIKFPCSANPREEGWVSTARQVRNYNTEKCCQSNIGSTLTGDN